MSDIQERIDSGLIKIDRYDWPDDFEHENGMYESYCTSCGVKFLGHKRRVTCKECAKSSAILSTDSESAKEDGINDKEKLEMAVSLLREWIYELAPLDEDKTSIGRDFQRMSGNTIYFLENYCKIGLENA